MSFISR